MWVGREVGWGQQCGMLFLQRGVGWVEGYPHQIYYSNTAKRQSMLKASVTFMQGSVCKLMGRVGTTHERLICLPHRMLMIPLKYHIPDKCYWVGIVLKGQSIQRLNVEVILAMVTF